MSFPARTVAGVVLDSAFVPPPKAADFLAGDIVTVRVDVADGRGTVARAKLAQRTRTHVCGTVTRVFGKLALAPDPHVGSAPIALAGERVATLTPGQVAMVQLPETVGPAARVTAVWDGFTPHALRAWMFSRHQLDLGRPETVDAEALELSRAAHRTLRRKPGRGRRDLRDLVTFTIDGASTRDLDDAVSVQPTRGGWRVWVHIADVATTVPAGSAVDRDAAASATSVYLPGWNRPMLPPALSEDALSLLPDVDRDTLTVAFTVTRDGQVRQVEMMRSRVRSDARLTYTGSAAALAAGTAGDLPGDVFDALVAADAAAAALGRERIARLTLTERDRTAATQVVTVTGGSATGDPYDGATFTQVPSTTPAATEQLIERLMVAANEAVAAWLVERELPGVFRTHAEPGAELAADVAALVEHLPRALRAPRPSAVTPVQQLADLEARLTASGQQSTVVDMLLMRHLERAIYTPEVGGHHGLASVGYVHFTSPIRRYADLLVHRVVHAHLDGDTATLTQLTEDLPSLCAHITDASGVAARIEGQFRRFATTMLLPTGPTRHVGVVTGFTAKGAFVDIPDLGVSGMLSFRDLPGRWDTDDRQVVAIEAGSGNALRLGDPIRVHITEADPVAGQVTVTKAARPPRRGRR